MAEQNPQGLCSVLEKAQSMNFRSGEICLVNFGDAYGGHRQIGVRPAIFISQTSRIAIVIPLTSNPKALRFGHTVTIRPNENNQLDRASVALVFQIQEVDGSDLMSKIGVLSLSEKRAINKAVREAVYIH